MHLHSLAMGGLYGHAFRTLKFPDITPFDWDFVKDRVEGGNSAAIKN